MGGIFFSLKKIGVREMSSERDEEGDKVSVASSMWGQKCSGLHDATVTTLGQPAIGKCFPKNSFKRKKRT